MTLHLIMLVVAVLLVGWASVQAVQLTPHQRIDVFRGATKRPRGATLLLALGTGIGFLAMFRLWRLDIGWWAAPLWLIPFFLAIYAPIVWHNRSVARASGSTRNS